MVSMVSEFVSTQTILTTAPTTMGETYCLERFSWRSGMAVSNREALVAEAYLSTWVITVQYMEITHD
jgi:hypothetical protein